MEIFGIGPLEFLLILIIMLVVLGPKDMVATGQKIGRFVRSVIRSPYWSAIMETSRDIRDIPGKLIREAGIEEDIAQLKKDTESTLGEINQDMKSTAQEIQQDLKETTQEMQVIVPPLLDGNTILPQQVLPAPQAAPAPQESEAPQVAPAQQVTEAPEGSVPFSSEKPTESLEIEPAATALPDAALPFDPGSPEALLTPPETTGVDSLSVGTTEVGTTGVETAPVEAAAPPPAETAPLEEPTAEAAADPASEIPAAPPSGEGAPGRDPMTVEVRPVAPEGIGLSVPELSHEPGNGRTHPSSIAIAPTQVEAPEADPPAPASAASAEAPLLPPPAPRARRASRKKAAPPEALPAENSSPSASSAEGGSTDASQAPPSSANPPNPDPTNFDI